MAAGRDGVMDAQIWVFLTLRLLPYEDRVIQAVTRDKARHGNFSILDRRRSPQARAAELADVGGLVS